MKKVLILFLLLFLVFVGLIVISKTKLYKLNYPKYDDVTKIIISNNSSSITIDNRLELNKIYKEIDKVGNTYKNSIQDVPVKTNKYFAVDFYLDSVNLSTMYLYNKNNMCYIEQPYNGIYNISCDSYNSILKYVNFR